MLPVIAMKPTACILLIALVLHLPGAIGCGQEPSPSPSPDAAIQALPDERTKDPFPKDYPIFDPEPISDWNMSGEESRFVGLLAANRELIWQLEDYDSGQVAREFDLRMEQETDIHLKLVYAWIAAKRSSERGKVFILSCRKLTDYEPVRSTLSALAHLPGDTNAPEWVIDEMIASLLDDRPVTKSDDPYRGRGGPYTISELADEHEAISHGLGSIKCRRAVPALIELAEKTDGGRGPVWALGEIGDPRAVPVLMKFLRARTEHGEFDPFRGELVEALGKLKVTEAVPILLEETPLYGDTIKALGRIGDARAIPALRAIVALKGAGPRDREVMNQPQYDPRRYAEAVFALDRLEPGAWIPSLIGVLEDQLFSEHCRWDAVNHLIGSGDQRAIGPLVETIKTDPKILVVKVAIHALSCFPREESVTGLIECFDVDFTKKTNGKVFHNFPPEKFMQNIARSLQRLTGQDFGPDKERWQRWWDAQEHKVP